MASESEWVSKAEACKILHVSERTMNRIIESGQVGIYTPPGGGRVKYKRVDLDAMRAAGLHPKRS